MYLKGTLCFHYDAGDTCIFVESCFQFSTIFTIFLILSCSKLALKLHKCCCYSTGEAGGLRCASS